MSPCRKINRSTAASALIIFFVATLFAVNGFPANLPLEIINIKSAGTGSPAIPSTNRIFRAYPGIEYNIRAAVIGGLYPFTYALSNAPTGMTIDSFTGEIKWPNPRENSGTITLLVTDSENTTVSTSWEVNVTIGGFLFVDASYSGIQTGSITQPFNSIASLLNNTSLSNSTDIVYFRGGMYQLVDFDRISETYYARTGGVTGKYGTNLTNRSKNWIGFPGETVNIDGDGRYITAYPGPIYFDSLNLYNFSDYGLVGNSIGHYTTIRRCNWSNLVAVNSGNNNQGYFFTIENGDGYYFVFQNNSFSNFRGAAALGSLYSTNKSLIENNYIHDDLGGGITGITAGIAIKYLMSNVAVRGNKVIMSHGAPLGDSLNALLTATSNVDISFNYFARLTSGTERGHAHYFNVGGDSSAHMLRNLYYYRNTVIGDTVFRYIDGNNCGASGPFRLYNNVIIDPNISYAGNWSTINFISYNIYSCVNNPQNCIGDINNLKGTPAQNIVDSNGNLTSSYSEYLGTHGFQTTDSRSLYLKPMAPVVLTIQ